MAVGTPQISDAEWEVMKVIWQRGSATAAEVVDDLAPATHWHPRTVKTMLNRLVRKGALDFKPEGKRYIYRARVSRQACVRRATRSFLRRVFDGAAAPAVAHFLEEAQISPREIEQLKRILDEGGRAGGAGGGGGR
jgi:BlaI family penicillinase repressor